MYDYVLQYGFDKETQDYIQSIKNTLKSNNIEDKERNWLPHITIDLYDCKNKNGPGIREAGSADLYGCGHAGSRKNGKNHRRCPGRQSVCI